MNLYGGLGRLGNVIAFVCMFTVTFQSATANNQVLLDFGTSLNAISGARTLMGIRSGVSGIEDIGRDKFPMEIYEGLRIALRSVGIVAIEMPINYLLMTLQHEFFGHGSRCKEFGGNPSYMYLSPPWPFGGGLASAFCAGKIFNGMRSHIVTVGGVTAVDVMRNHFLYQSIS